MGPWMSSSPIDPVTAEGLVQFVAQLEAFEGCEVAGRIRDHLGRFNVFVAAGLMHHEIRHSRFLASLLDPSGSHGLGDRFLRRLVSDVRGTAFEGELSRVKVLTEAWRVDLLLVDDVAGWFVAIENKINAGEHGDQLSRYIATLDREYPSARYPVRHFVLLSPNAWKPSHGEYSTFGYARIAGLLEESLLDAQELVPDVRIAIAHYIDLLRCYVLEDVQLAELCREAYRKHGRVIDTIIANASTSVAPAVADHVRALIERSAAFNIAEDEHAGRTILRCADTALDGLPWMSKGRSDWTASGRSLLFELTNRSNSLMLELVIGTENEDVRRALMKLSALPPFTAITRASRWQRIYRQLILSSDDYERVSRGEMTLAELLEAVTAEWDRFIVSTLPDLRRHLVALEVPSLATAE